MNKILIIGPAWVGDMVMAQSLFRLLNEQRPGCNIDVLAPAWTKALLERMPEVRRSLALPLAHGEFGLKKRFKLGQTLRAEKYDQAIVLPNSWKSALVPFFTRIPRRTGFKGEMRYGLLNDLRRLDKGKLPLMIERFLSLGLDRDAPLPKKYPLPKLKAKDAEKVLNKYQLNLDKPILAICPGAEYGEAKRWPSEYFTRVANHYCDQNFQVWLLGSQNDLTLANTINAKTKNRCVNLVSRTTLAKAVDLLSCAQKVLTNDSGLMHIACALELPVVALFGSSSPAFTPPLGNQAKILSLNLNCSPCFERTCPLKHFNCMRDLSPEKVLEELAN